MMITAGNRSGTAREKTFFPIAYASITTYSREGPTVFTVTSL